MRITSMCILSLAAAMLAVGSPSLKAQQTDLGEARQPSAEDVQIMRGVPDIADQRGNHFVQRSGRFLTHRGKQFRLAGSNNYYPTYESQFMVDDLLTTAAANSFNAFRFFGFIDIGNQDGSNSINPPTNGVYFHYWDGAQPAFNDGPTGLEHMDYVIYRAGQLGLKVIIPLVDNWGGMDQYVRWAGGQYHDQFYSDPTIRQWYKDWVEHVLNRTNIYTGIKYKDDATILTWELANEPRCGGSGPYPTSSLCTTETVTHWADDISTLIKRIDRKHLVSAGDEGFYCKDRTSSDWTINCSQGDDSLALARLPNIDVLSMHLYPDGWGKTWQWGTQWIAQHIEDSHRLGDRAILGEFGVTDKALRNPIYYEWEKTILHDDGAGGLYWILSGKQDNGTYYPDYDGYTVYCPSPVCLAFSNFARTMEYRPPVTRSPVADDDLASTPNNTPVTLDLVTNDITYQHSELKLDSIDLDPATPGQQTTFTNQFGTYMLQGGGNVRFVPSSPCVSGNVSTPYVIKDDRGRTSNPANIVVSVQGITGQLYNFEDGTDTWAAASFTATAGTTAQSTISATSCSHSLEIVTTAGGWFTPSQSTPPLPLSLTNVHQILMDITTGSVPTSQSVALQVGSDYHWCQTSFGYLNTNTTTTVTVDLASLFTTANCGGTLPVDTTSVRGMLVFFGPGGTYFMDNVRTQ